MTPYIRRMTFVSVSLLIGTAVSMFIVNDVQTPLLYALDELEKRDCRICGGSGEDLGMPELGPRCHFCRGSGQVSVILPGPNRPTKFQGLVVDARTVSHLTSYSRLTKGNGMTPFQRPQGAITGAAIFILDVDGNTIEKTSNGHGKFKVRLVPGSYSIIIKVPGFETLEGEFAVPVLTEPIWLEKANLIEEPRSAAEALSLYGFEGLFALAPAGKRPHWRVQPGGP